MFTKYGKREIAIYGTLSGLVMLAVIVLAFSFIRRGNVAALICVPFVFTFILILYFFRDPERPTPRGENRLVAPADGIVFDIGEVDEPVFLGEKAIRIGIFLSVFDCHVNRIPCSGTVEKIKYKRGAFFSALKARQCSRRNESNLIGIANAAGTGVKIAVKQIAGQIARRIVCDLKEGAEVRRGQAFGMIKFGSRTEIFIPKSANFRVRVKLRHHLKGGQTVIGTLEPPSETLGEQAR